MKSNLLFIIVAIFFLIACGNDASHKEKEATIITNVETRENTTTLSSNEVIKDCEDFINRYEEWSDQLLTIMAKYKENPIGLATSSEYIDTMTKGINFIQDWETIAFSCATNPTYETRMKAIQEKMETRQKELGFK